MTINRYSIQQYGPSIGTAAACIGVVATGVLSAYAMAKFLEKDIYPGDETKEFLKSFALPAAVGIATIGTFCMVRSADKKTIAGLSAATVALSSQLVQTNNAIKEECGEEVFEKIGERVDKMRWQEDKDVLILDPDSSIWFEPTTGIKFMALSETVTNSFYKLNRNYQLRGGLASLYEWMRMLGIKKRDIKERGLEWTRYIGWHGMWLDMDCCNWIDFADIDETVDNKHYISLEFCTPLMPICINPPDVVHMICHTDEEDLSELLLDRDDVDTEISRDIMDDKVE